MLSGNDGIMAGLFKRLAFVTLVMCIVPIMGMAQETNSEWDVKYDQANALFEKDDLEQAKTVAQEALAIAERADGSGHEAVIDSLNLLTNVYFILEDYSKAIPLLVRALAITEKTADPMGRSVVYQLNMLGQAYY